MPSFGIAVLPGHGSAVLINSQHDIHGTSRPKVTSGSLTRMGSAIFQKPSVVKQMKTSVCVAAKKVVDEAGLLSRGSTLDGIMHDLLAKKDLLVTDFYAEMKKLPQVDLIRPMAEDPVTKDTLLGVFK